jgi:Ca2+:H+ antiporter
MHASDQIPLLSANRRQRRSRHCFQNIVARLKADGEPSWLNSYRWFLFGSWLNLLLLLTPVAVAAHYLNWDAPLRFGLCLVAIIPLAKVCNLVFRLLHELHVVLISSQLVGIAAEEMSLLLGPSLAGLLSATLGNSVEIVVGIVALFQGEVRIAQTAVCTRSPISVQHMFTVCTPRCLVPFYPASSWVWAAPSSRV